MQEQAAEDWVEEELVVLVEGGLFVLCEEMLLHSSL